MRWLKQHGPLVQQTALVEDTALTHAEIFEDVADALWDSHATINNTTTPRPAVASAVDVLTSGSLTTLPRFSSAIKSDDRAPEKRALLTSEVSEVTQQLVPSASNPVLSNSKPCSASLRSFSPSVTERLGIATRNCIRESLLHLGALNILSWRSGIADVCVKVGMDTLWSADVSLDSLDPDNAVLRVHAINLIIRNDTDAPGQQYANDPNPPLVSDPLKSQTTTSQQSMLRRMADDRMKAALHAARNVSKPPSSVNATCVMLCALRDMMMDDVCAPLTMDYLRAQALALSNERWKGVLVVEGALPDTPRSVPLTVHYWLQHRQPALIRICEFRTTTSESDSDTVPSVPDENKCMKPPVDVTLERRLDCVTCSHQPSLPSVVDLGGAYSSLDLQMNQINLEELILTCIRLRSRARLKHISHAFLRRRAQLRIHPSCIVLSQSRKACTDGNAQRTASAGDILSIQFGGSGQTGMEIRIFSMTGGTRIRPYGAAALSIPVGRVKDCHLWTGTKHFKSLAKEVDAVILAFEAIRARVKLNASARSVCALDVGVSNTLPPGTASVAATASQDRAASQLVPPFAPLERRAPRRFLTLSPPPPPNDMLGRLLQYNGGSVNNVNSRTRTASARSVDRHAPSKRPRLTYATTSDALVFIQESSFAGEDWRVNARTPEKPEWSASSKLFSSVETDSIDRYSGTAAAAAAWAVTREVVERRLRRDSLLRAFVAATVASAAQMHHLRTSEDGDLHLESASRVLLKVKCEPLPVRRAELLLRGYDAWQVRLSLLPSIFDSTDCSVPLNEEKAPNASKKDNNSRGDGNLWSVGVAYTGSQLTFTYPSANAASVRSFFRDLTRARTAAALARGVPPSRFYRVLRRSPVRIVVGIEPHGHDRSDTKGDLAVRKTVDEAKARYTATVEYVYSKGNSGGFSLSFSPSNQTMEQLAPLIEEALDASGGQVGGILAGLLERACPVAAAAESAVRVSGKGKIRFVTALRVRAVFAGVQKTVVKNSGQTANADARAPNKPVVQTGHVLHGVDVDARGGSGLVTVIDVGRATAVMIQQGFAHRTGSSCAGSNKRSDFVSLPKWDEIVAALKQSGHAEAQRAGSTVVLKMEVLEQFLSDLVSSAGSNENI